MLLWLTSRTVLVRSERTNSTRAVWDHYALPGEESAAARCYFLLAMNQAAPRALFDELIELWRASSGWHKVVGWARKWHLLGTDRTIPDWLRQQIDAAFTAWDTWADRWQGLIPPYWPLVTDGRTHWVSLTPGRQQRAILFAQRHPQFDPTCVNRRTAWLRRRWAQYLGLRPARRIAWHHFIWAVRFQLGGETVDDIVRTESLASTDGLGPTRQAVWYGIHRVLRLVGLKPRRDRPGPHPGNRRDG
jgi:hypothetical protein